MARTAGFGNIISAFRSRKFRDFQIGRFISWTGAWTFRVALSWLVWETTGSSVWLGVVAFANLAPAVVVSPLVGALCDRMDRMRILYISQFLLVIHGVGLSALVTLDLAPIEVLVLFAFVHGIVDASQATATHAVQPALVPVKDLTAAYGINSLSFNLTRFLGPAVGGILISEWGTSSALVCNAVGSLIFFLVLIGMDADMGEVRKDGKHQVLRDVSDGVRYAARHEGIGPILVMIVMLSVLVFHLHQFLPAFADPVFHMGAHGLAWLISAMGVGAMVQGALIASRGDIAGLTSSILRNILLISCGVLLLTATDIYWVALPAMFMIGYGVSGTRVTSMTLIQHSVAGEMRGRMVSFYTVVTHVGPAVGALIIGPAAEHFGIRPTFATSAVLVIGVSGWVFLRRRRMAAALENSSIAAIEAEPEKRAS